MDEWMNELVNWYLETDAFELAMSFRIIHAVE